MSKICLAAEITVLVDRNATVAEVTLLSGNNRAAVALASSSGSSKRENGDVYDPGIGLALAVGRALDNLGWDLIDEANDQVQKATKAADAKQAKADAK